MPRYLYSFLALAALLTCWQITQAEASADRIVVQNFYYALPGKAEEVYKLRLHASEVRASLGLARGRVLRRMQTARDPAKPLPDVIWECEYPSAVARDNDVAALGHSQEFERIEAQMGTLIRDFRRALFTVSGE